MAVRIEPSGGVDRYLRAFRAFNRNVKLFLVTTAFRGTVITALATVLNLYLYSLGYDARFIGLINAANSLAVLLVSVPMGYVADRVGRRKVLVAGGIAYPLSILGLALSSSTSTILAFNFLFGAVPLPIGWRACFCCTPAPIRISGSRPFRSISFC